MKQSFFKRLTSAAALAAAICAATSPAGAEDKAVTLKEIMAMARESNGDLRALRQEKEIGKAGKIRAGLYANPVLEMEGSTGALTGSPSEDRVSIGLSQEFATGGKREKRVAVAETELARFGNRIRDAERLLLLEVKTGFYDLLLAQKRLDLAHKAHELNSQLLQISQERFAAGDVAELDANLAGVETARSETRTSEAEREIISARQHLLTLMGAPLSADLKVAGPPETRPLSPSLAELKALAQNNRPDIRAAESEKNKGEAELTLAEAERLPNVTAGIEFSREATLTSLGGLEEKSTDYLVGLKLSIPLPFFDRNQAGIVEAKARKSSAETRLAFALQGIEREVEAAYARLAAAKKSLDIYDTRIIPQLTENLKVVQEAYRLGEVGILSVLEEQKKFIEVNNSYLMAFHDLGTAIAKLEAAVGVELKKDNGGTK